MKLARTHRHVDPYGFDAQEYHRLGVEEWPAFREYSRSQDYDFGQFAIYAISIAISELSDNAKLLLVMFFVRKDTVTLMAEKLGANRSSVHRGINAGLNKIFSKIRFMHPCFLIPMGHNYSLRLPRWNYKAAQSTTK